MEQDPGNILIFLHIVKTAGTSLRWALEDKFPCQQALRAYHALGLDPDDIGALPESVRARFRFFTSHKEFGTHALFPQPATYVTMLREPVSRLLSEFRAFPKFKQNRSEGGLARFIDEIPDYRVDNKQVRCLADAMQVEEVTAGHLETAKRNLRQHFPAVGITERFELSLALFCRVFGWHHLTLVKRNAGPPPLADESRFEEALRGYNRLDLELYAFANDLFDAQLAEHEVTPEDLPRFVRGSWPARARLHLSRAFRKIERKLRRLP